MPSTERPNILLIMSDQHRFDYMGCAATGFIRTPNMDRLAARGVRFTTCITNSPVCAPARIGLASGLIPSRLGALENHSFLRRSVPTYYQRLRDHGYRVGCVGKLDLAKPDGYNGRYGDRPCTFGWGFTHPEECEGKMHAGQTPMPKGPYGLMLAEASLYDTFHQDYVRRRNKGWAVGASWDSVLPTAMFEDAYIGRRAAEWISNVPDDFPWHYFVSFVGPHDPFDPPAEYADIYRETNVPDPVDNECTGKPEWICRRRREGTVEEVRQARQQYCASTTLIDDQIGLILDALESRGQLENTYIIYTSDHGEMLGDHRLWTKSVPYEPSVHVPLLVSGPDIEPGRTSHALVELIDVNPTICQMAGLMPQENIDAQSMFAVATGERLEHRHVTLSTMPNFNCARTKRWKYVENHNSNAELYDLETDPHELNNVFQENRETARDLHTAIVARKTEGKWLR